MSIEIPKTHDRTKIIERFETCFESEKEFDDFKKIIEPVIGEEGSEKIIFSLKSVMAEDFTNQCNKATQEFGSRLNAKNDENESFFEIDQDANYYDARCDQIPGYKGDFHSVGLIEIKNENNEKKSLIFDLTYSDLGKGRRGAILFLLSQGNTAEALEILKKNYKSSTWKINFKLDKKKNTFVYCEND